MKIKNINEGAIKTCHRVQQKIVNTDNARPPAILVRFTDYSIRGTVLRNRKLLKSTNIFIQEDLTKYRLTLMSNLLKKFQRKDVWCCNGNIYLKCNDVVQRIDSEDDIPTANIKAR